MQIIIGFVSLQLGNIFAINATGKVRSLNVGDDVFSDDKINVPDESQLEISLYDGGTVSLDKSLYQMVESQYATTNSLEEDHPWFNQSAQGRFSFNPSLSSFEYNNREQHSNYTIILRSAEEIDPSAGFDVLAANKVAANLSDYIFDSSLVPPKTTVYIKQISDNQSPLIALIPHAGYSNDTSPLLSGTVSQALFANETLVILRNENPIGTASVTGLNWEFQDSNLLTDEQYHYQAKIINTANLEGPLSNLFTIHIDTDSPQQIVTITNLLDDQPNISYLNSGETTNDLNPLVLGTLNTALASNDVINIYRDSVLIGEASVSGLSWSFLDSNLLDATSYLYEAQIVDSAGNAGLISNTFTIHTDYTAPTQLVSINDIQDNTAPNLGTIINGGHTNDTTPVLNGTLNVALLAGEAVSILRDGVAIGQATVTTTNWS